MGPRPLVSVLTPCFNSARYLESCISSVEQQEYERVEHIVQDAGSSDETLAILRRHKDSVNWVSEPDAGGIYGFASSRIQHPGTSLTDNPK